MRLRLALALLTGALLANGAQAESNDMHILIGSYTHDSDSPGVLRLRFDPSQGRLEPEPLQALTSHNPSWLVLDERRGRLYATHENGPAHADPVGRVGAWQRDAKGDYQPIGQAISLGDEPTHASLSADGRYLFVSNYGSRPRRQPGSAAAGRGWPPLAGHADRCASGQRSAPRTPGIASRAFGGAQPGRHAPSG